MPETTPKSMSEPMPKPNDSTRLLPKALRANAAFSTFSGLAMLMASPRLAPWLSEQVLPRTLQVLGAGLLAFAAYTLWISFRPVHWSRYVPGIIFGDLGWTIGSLFLLLGPWVEWTPGGRLAVGGVALLVFAFAMAQGLGLKRLGSTR